MSTTTKELTARRDALIDELDLAQQTVAKIARKLDTLAEEARIWADTEEGVELADDITILAEAAYQAESILSENLRSERP